MNAVSVVMLVSLHSEYITSIQVYFKNLFLHQLHFRYTMATFYTCVEYVKILTFLSLCFAKHKQLCSLKRKAMKTQIHQETWDKNLLEKESECIERWIWWLSAIEIRKVFGTIFKKYRLNNYTLYWPTSLKITCKQDNSVCTDW